MTDWYYAQARKLSDKTFVGWLGASGTGSFELIGDEKDDPTKLSRVLAVGLDVHDDKTYLRAPAYHDHGSASLGGYDTNGYRAEWKWGETRGYPVEKDGRGVLRDENGRVLSLYMWAGKHQGSWEANEKEALIIDFAQKA